MINEFSGNLDGKGLKIGIVTSRWNEFMAEKLLAGANDCLIRHGVLKEDVDIARVPGSFEIPLAAKKMAGCGRYDAIICLGVIIRGETPHFEFIATETTKGIAQIGLQSGIPITFGVVTCDTVEQAIVRSGSKSGNKGFEAATSAIEMVNLIKQI